MYSYILTFPQKSFLERFTWDWHKKLIVKNDKFNISDGYINVKFCFKSYAKVFKSIKIPLRSVIKVSFWFGCSTWNSNIELTLPWMNSDKFFSRSNIHQNSRTISTLMNLPMNFEGFIGVEIWFASAASLNRTLHVQNMMFGYMTIKIIKLFGSIFAITVGAYLTR